MKLANTQYLIKIFYVKLYFNVKLYRSLLNQSQPYHSNNIDT